MEVVLAHPNGWGIREQTFLRKVATDAGLSVPEKAQRNIRFLSEAEASVHFCIHHTNLGNRLQPGTHFAVCDAGGSTVDTTLYSVVSLHPLLKLEEKRASACVQAGAIFVDLEAEGYLRKSLSSVGLNADEIKDYTKAGMKDFEGGAKRGFQDEIVDQHITHILLVGGFGDSPYLREQFKKRYEPQGSQITRTNDSTSKAVADGAVIWNIVNSVSSRAPRYSFGVICARVPHAALEGSERRRAFMGPHGFPLVPGGVALDAEAVCRETYTSVHDKSRPDLSNLSMDIYCYSADDEPVWAWDENDDILPDFRKSCTISADLRGLEGALERRKGRRGNFWSLKIDVCMRFGGTELEAYIEWKDEGVTRTGPVFVVPGDPIEI
ncbi:ATP binding, partial [Rhizoctonia solani]